MQFKIGDKVMINRKLPNETVAGRVGVIRAVEMDLCYYGPYAVYAPDAIYYCNEREISHTDAPWLPWDNDQDFREWSREVETYGTA